MPNTKHAAFYRSNKWRQLSLRVVKEEPVCWLRLPGCTYRSTTADHLVPISVNPNLALARSNARGSCRNCNSLRRDTSIPELAQLRAQLHARPMTRQQALAALKGRRYRPPARALRLFDGPGAAALTSVRSDQPPRIEPNATEATRCQGAQRDPGTDR
jgi:5-methylcytosine-specific restriction endonuclease McrA